MVLLFLDVYGTLGLLCIFNRCSWLGFSFVVWTLQRMHVEGETLILDIVFCFWPDTNHLSIALAGCFLDSAGLQTNNLG